MIQLIRGFKDILPPETELWQHIEKIAKSVFEDFGFKEIRIPVMEKTELFARSIGEATDIVEKEMYTFADRKGELLTLRPEATACVVRAYIQHKMYAKDPVQKFYTIGPMFRRERPQKGRYRQFYQINAEVFGVSSPKIDAQLIFIVNELFSRLLVKDVTAHINSLGCPECRPRFKKALLEFLKNKKDELCGDCQRRIEKNPLRVLDCKVPGCRKAMGKAPSLIKFLCHECHQHFDFVKKYLDDLEVSYNVDEKLVRGLDYYTRTTFEMLTGSLGAQSAVAGGGRYDGLMSCLGGPEIPAIGFAIGFDRLAEIAGIEVSGLVKKPHIFIAALGEKCQKTGFLWNTQFCKKGIRAEMDMSGKSLKSQMKKANRMDAEYVLIFGENELESGKAILRNMVNKEQIEVPLDNIVENIKKEIF